PIGTRGFTLVVPPRFGSALALPSLAPIPVGNRRGAIVRVTSWSREQTLPPYSNSLLPTPLGPFRHLAPPASQHLPALFGRPAAYLSRTALLIASRQLC